jgi:hypothetical protein
MVRLPFNAGMAKPPGILKRFKPIRRKRITHFLKRIPAYSVPFQRGDQVFNDAVSDDMSKVFPGAHRPYPLKRGI